MPSYNFINNKNGEEFTEFFTISGKEEYLLNNPHIEQTVSTVNIVDPYSIGKLKVDKEFRSLLRQVKKNNIHSSMKVD